MTKRILVLAFIIVLGLGASVILAADESTEAAADTSAKQDGEYMAFEFFLSGTAERRYKMMEDQRDPKLFYDTTRALLDYRNKNFSLFVDWSMIDDERFEPTESYMLGRYFYIHDAYVDYETDRFYLKAGRSAQEDVIDSPYSLFVSSESIPSVQVETKYKGDFFFYTNRWVRLNKNSANTYFGYGPGLDAYPESDPPDNKAEFKKDHPNGVHWVDRGANFHEYGINLGNWRFGFQESAVYMFDDFNAEFFFSPMIMYFTQLVVEGGTKPWNEYANSKHMMGFFLDRTTPDCNVNAQLLVDDVNASILPGIEVENLNRLAWTVGGSRQFEFGRLGFYHGGATQHTFAATYVSDHGKDYTTYKEDQVPVHYSNRPYQYTYYPAVQYDLDGTPMPIDYRENYIGYKYGENNLSFMFDYTRTFRPRTPQQFSLYSSLEWALNGAKSPANPWHEYGDWREIPDPTQLLGGTVEHIAALQTRIDKPVKLFGKDFSLFADMEAGMVFNAMGLEPASADVNEIEPWIYRPQRGEHEPVLRLTLGASYLWRVK